MGKRCLITGSTGLIGRQVVSSLGKQWELFALVNTAARKQREGVETACIERDLSLAWDTEGFPGAVDAVIHLAQSESFREFPDQSPNIFGVNTASTLYLLDYARRARAKTFILASSGGVYGWGRDAFSEEFPIAAPGGRGFYVDTKLCAEVLAENYIAFMDVVILRFFFVYGPGQRAGMFIPRLVQTVREGRPILLDGQEGFNCNPAYVTDAALSVCRSLELNASHKVNVAGPEVLSLRQIGSEIGRILGRAPLFEVRKGASPMHLIGNTERMSELLGRPVIGFKEGVAKYIAGEANGAGGE